MRMNDDELPPVVERGIELFSLAVFLGLVYYFDVAGIIRRAVGPSISAFVHWLSR
jgi:hypothetical protein